MATKPTPPPARERVQIPSNADEATKRLIDDLYWLAEGILAGKVKIIEYTATTKVEDRTARGILHVDFYR